MNRQASLGCVGSTDCAITIAVERDKLRLQLRDFVAERGDELLLGPLTHVGRTERIHRPVIATQRLGVKKDVP
jgi:hypothetical protein